MPNTKFIQLISGLPQSDMAETDPTKPSYVKNKPPTVDAGVVDAVNVEMAGAIDTDLAGAIDVELADSVAVDTGLAGAVDVTLDDTDFNGRIQQNADSIDAIRSVMATTTYVENLIGTVSQTLGNTEDLGV